MKTFSSNDVQKSVGGILTYIGFQALAWTALLIAGPAKTGWATIMFAAFPGLALFIGVRMFTGKAEAVSWAIAFLCAYVLLGLGVATVTLLKSSSAVPIRSFMFFSTSVPLLAPAVLMGLLLWCRSRWVRNKTAALTSECTE
jgi:hypothetical protein